MSTNKKGNKLRFLLRQMSHGEPQKKQTTHRLDKREIERFAGRAMQVAQPVKACKSSTRPMTKKNHFDSGEEIHLIGGEEHIEDAYSTAKTIENWDHMVQEFSNVRRAEFNNEWSHSRKTTQTNSRKSAPLVEDAEVISEDSNERKESHKMSENDLQKDIEAILKQAEMVEQQVKGESAVLDKDEKEAIEKQETESPSNEVEVENVSKEKDIETLFDRLDRSEAQSTTIDLGTIDLSNKFEAFDRQLDLEEKEKNNSVLAQSKPPNANPIRREKDPYRSDSITSAQSLMEEEEEEEENNLKHADPGFVDRFGNQVLVFRKKGTKELNYKFNEEYSESKKKKALKDFMKTSDHVLQSLNNSEVGYKLIQDYQSLSTSIRIKTLNKANPNVNSFVIRSKEITNSQYNYVTLTPFLKNYAAKYGSYDEWLGAVMMVEFMHLQPESVELKKKIGYSIDKTDPRYKQIYEPIFNASTSFRVKYRNEMQLPILVSTFDQLDNNGFDYNSFNEKAREGIKSN